MKQTIPVFLALYTLGGVYAAKFELPACASTCTSISNTCDTTDAFCGSACFGPCLTSGCSAAYDQQRLIKACSNSFASAGPSASATVTATTTRKPEKTGALSTSANGTETSTKPSKTDSVANPAETPDREKTATNKTSTPLPALPSPADHKSETNSTAGNSTAGNSTSSNSTTTEPPANGSGAAQSFAVSLSTGVALFVVALALLQ